jgi:predicted RNA-binding protein with PIN domain
MEPARDVAFTHPEQGLRRADVPPAHFDEAQAEQALWQEFCDHGVSINNALTEALRIQGSPSIRLFEVSVLCSTRGLFLIFFTFECFLILLSPRVLDCCSQELEGRARARYDCLAQLSIELDWYQGQYDALYALVEALQTYNGWLEYRLRAVWDAPLGQRAQTMEGASAVDLVKTALLEQDDALQKACAALAEAQTAAAEKETTLTVAQAELQQDRATLEGARSWQAQTEEKAKEAEKLGADLAEKVTSLAAVGEQLR